MLRRGLSIYRVCAQDDAKARTAVKGCSKQDSHAFRSLLNLIAVDGDAPPAVVAARAATTAVKKTLTREHP